MWIPQTWGVGYGCARANSEGRTGSPRVHGNPHRPRAQVDELASAAQPQTASLRHFNGVRRRTPCRGSVRIPADLAPPNRTHASPPPEGTFRHEESPSGGDDSQGSTVFRVFRVSAAGARNPHSHAGYSDFRMTWAVVRLPVLPPRNDPRTPSQAPGGGSPQRPKN